MPETVCIIGEGSFGTAIATVIANNGHNVKLWCYDQKIAESINNNHINSQYYPELILDKKIQAITDFQDLKNIKYIFEAIPVKFLRSVLVQAKPFVNQNQTWVTLSKGIEQNTFLFPSQIIDDVFKIKLEKAILAGPSFANEIINKQATAVNIAGKNEKITSELKKILQNEYFKVFIIHDAIGAQICSALKNVISLAIGINDGANYGENSKGILITTGFNEIIKFIKHFNGDANTVNELCGIGDLIISSFTQSGRNYKVGRLIGQGQKIENILKDGKLTAEGVNTVQSVYQMINKNNLDLPLCKGIYKVIFENMKFDNLMREIINI